MLRNFLIAAVALGPLAAAPAAEAAPAAPAAPIAPPAAASPPTPAALTTAPGQYRIGVNDELEITVFQVPEMSRTVQVDSTGEFILPIVGRVNAAGKTADELGALLTQQLDGRYLKDPLITVVVKQAVSNRVTVDGAVTKAGVYALSGPTTLMQALALANGPNAQVANLHRVAIFRISNGERKAQVYDLVKIRQGKAPDPVVLADDIVVVDASGPRSFFTYYGQTLPILTLMRPY